jgi:hypothetical protein
MWIKMKCLALRVSTIAVSIYAATNDTVASSVLEHGNGNAPCAARLARPDARTSGAVVPMAFVGLPPQHGIPGQILGSPGGAVPQDGNPDTTTVTLRTCALQLVVSARLLPERN